MESSFISFSEEIRKDTGEAIFDIQKASNLVCPYQNLSKPIKTYQNLSEPIKTVSDGVEEIRVKDKTGIYRVFYLARFKDKVLIFHAFIKKTKRRLNKKSKLEKKIKGCLPIPPCIRTTEALLRISCVVKLRPLTFRISRSDVVHFDIGID